MAARRVSRRPAAGGNGLPQALHPVLRRVLAGRNVASMAELEYRLANLYPFDSLAGAVSAATLLADLMAAGKRLLVVADYDVDGATSCALAVRALTAMGAAEVDYVVPDRFLHGYGLSPSIARLVIERQPDCVITVDNGIASLEGVALLREQGIEVLITDHHLPGRELPDASVIVDPNVPGDDFPSKHLAGVGVVFYILAALRAELRRRDWFAYREIPEPNLAAFLDLVALGTVADVVPLDYNNRILVDYGLSLIRAGRCVPGIRALLQIAGRVPAGIAAADMGFVIGPRLNAAGRLTDMRLGIECLLSDDEAQALSIAGQLDELNRERRDIQNEMHHQAMADLAKLDLSLGADLPHGLCLFRPHWHAGVVGILASRMKEQSLRPVVAFAVEEDDMLKGSARSIPGLHIKDLFDRIATAHPQLIERYGGHAMAAGLTLRRDNLETFSRLFDAEVKIHLQTYGFPDTLVTDGELAATEFTLQLAETLRDAGPWGQGFPEPMFEGEFEVVDRRLVGKKHLKLVLRHRDGRYPVDAIAFNTTDRDWPSGTRKVYSVYKLDINDYRGRRQLQLLVDYVEPIG